MVSEPTQSTSSLWAQNRDGPHLLDTKLVFSMKFHKYFLVCPLLWI